MRNIFRLLLLTFVLCSSAFAQTSPSASAASAPKPEAILGAGDVVKITVFQQPDLTVDGARISEANQINFPLLGNVVIGGLSVSAAELKIAKLLRDGGFVLRPQVTISVGQIRSAVISVLARWPNRGAIRSRRSAPRCPR
jgi:polysaccharide export outer membrane protein